MNNQKSPIICICNNVPQNRIEEAIKKGCKSLDKIFDATQAGVGPCGGTCRPIITGMINQYDKEKTFPKNARKKFI